MVLNENNHYLYYSVKGGGNSVNTAKNKMTRTKEQIEAMWNQAEEKVSKEFADDSWEPRSEDQKKAWAAKYEKVTGKKMQSFSDFLKTRKK